MTILISPLSQVAYNLCFKKNFKNECGFLIHQTRPQKSFKNKQELIHYEQIMHSSYNCLQDRIIILSQDTIAEFKEILVYNNKNWGVRYYSQEQQTAVVLIALPTTDSNKSEASSSTMK
ncbi:1906_t:CDS:2, partial [Racocetra persica]